MARAQLRTERNSNPQPSDTPIAACVGSNTMIYDMWGSAVDLAYQIQAGGGEPGIYITSRVRDAVHDTHRFTQAGQFTAGDAQEPVWRLTGRR